MEKLTAVLEELKDQVVAIKEKGEIQWRGLAQNFNTYYYDTRNVVCRTKAGFHGEVTVLELD